MCVQLLTRFFLKLWVIVPKVPLLKARSAGSFNSSGSFFDQSFEANLAHCFNLSNNLKILGLSLGVDPDDGGFYICRNVYSKLFVAASLIMIFFRQVIFRWRERTGLKRFNSPSFVGDTFKHQHGSVAQGWEGDK